MALSGDEALLASLGYKQEFKRAFHPFEVFGVAFSNIGVVPALASVFSIAVSNGGAVTMVWGWLLGLFIVLCIEIAIAELASSAPTSGGLYYLTYKLASPRCCNILCWIVGYAITIGYVVGMASGTWACTVQINAAAVIGSNGAWVISTSKSYGIFAALLLSQGVICSLGTKVLARLQRVYVTFNVLLCLIIIVALPIATPKELMNSPSYVFGNFTNLSGWPNVFTFFIGLLTPLWAVGCYDCVTHITEESSNAAIAAPWGMVSATAIAGVLGWAMNIVLAFCMGPDLTSIIDNPINQPLAKIFLNSFGQRWALVVWSLVIVSQYMAGTAGLLVSSRQSFAFARDGALPFSGILYKMNTYTGTPVNTVWFDCGCALLVGLLVLLGPVAINAVFTTTVAALFFAYSIPIASRFVFENDFKPGPFFLGALSAPISAIAVVSMVFMLVIFCFPSSPGPQVATMNYTVVVFGGVMFLAIVWYYFPVYGGVHWFRGPAYNVDPKAQTEFSGKEESESGEEKLVYSYVV